jgi:hypothetical protein
MSQLAEIDEEALLLVRLYRAQGNKMAALRLANGSGHESVRRQALFASMTANELREKFDLDADDLLEELTMDDAVAEIATYATNYNRTADFEFALRSVQAVRIYRHDLGSVGRFVELPEGSSIPSSFSVNRSHALELMLERFAIEVDVNDIFQATTITRYFRVRLTPLGEALLARLQD